MDQDLHAPTLGIGGAMNAFRTAQNFHVNDPRFYLDQALEFMQVSSLWLECLVEVDVEIARVVPG